MAVEKIDPIVDSLPLTDFEIEETGDLEADVELEHKKILRDQQADNLGIILDSEYYSLIYFVSKQDRDEFFDKLAKIKGDVYINGYDLAEKLGIKISEKAVNLPKPKFINNFKLKVKKKIKR